MGRPFIVVDLPPAASITNPLKVAEQVSAQKPYPVRPGEPHHVCILVELTRLDIAHDHVLGPYLTRRVIQPLNSL